MESFIFKLLVVLVPVVLLGFPFYLGFIIWERLRARRRGQPTLLSRKPLYIYIILILSIVLGFWALLGTMHVHSPSSEAKNNLGAIFTGQVAYFGEFNTYGRTFNQIAWQPEGENHYAYYMADDFIPCRRRCLDSMLDSNPEPWPWPVKPESTSASFTCLAVGNIDDDTVPDVWIIDERKGLENIVKDVNLGTSMFNKFHRSFRMHRGTAIIVLPLSVIFVLLGSPLLVVAIFLDYNNYTRRKKTSDPDQAEPPSPSREETQ